MQKLLLTLLISLMLLDASLPVEGKKSRKTKGNASDIVNPKTFNARKKTNSTELNLTSLLPELEVTDNHIIEYSTGILSTRIIPLAYIVAIAVGIPANGFILGTVSTKTKAFSTAILYCSLAVSDLLFLLTLCFKIHYHLSGNHWVFGEAACRVVTACFYGNAYCSIHTLACIGIKRYMAIVHPFTYKSMPKRRCTVCSILVVWVVFLVAMVPELIVHQSYHLPQAGITTCHDVLPLEDPSHSFLLYYKLGLTFFGFVPSFLVTVFTYGSIIRRLSKSDSDWVRYIKVSTLVFVIFTVCFTPSSVIHFAHYVKLYTSSQDHFYVYYSVAVCLCGLHSCLDPFLFNLMSKTTGSKRTFMWLRGKNISIST
ncbi:hypothetical protein AAFF_G00316310 [Aldrovandia affinis]|uniref:G-protein coupled receptors family 1 profile domain-containing protein n=1 Tax=Aldrovandia affinis TaxID=143900 RepID=A0AAD7SPZ9_9TELE|nr:hypothetical protein AAFF_G00316310 [Aldrovandia affinis]